MTSYGAIIDIDVGALRAAAEQMRATIPAAHAAAKVALAAGGELVKNTAASNASYSQRIPGSIRVQVTSGLVVNVIAGGDAAPDAAPIENRGKGFVRHPVFGNRQVWTAKNSHPAFLTPAGRSNEAAIVALYEKTVGDAVRDVFERGMW